MPAPGVSLESENGVVLSVMQALLGFITPQWRGVAVEVTRDEVTVFIAVTDGDDEALNEDIDDMIGDVVNFLMPETPDVTKRIHVGATWPDWEGRAPGRRRVFVAKDDEDTSATTT